MADVRRMAVWIAVMVVLHFGGNAVAGEVEESAIDAAKAWLAVVDDGDYARSWDEAAGFLKRAVPQDNFVASVEPVRGPLGEVVSRRLKSAQHTSELPGVPDGDYVIIQFTTSFANKKNAVETVTPMLDTDGVWRVSGYYIR